MHVSATDSGASGFNELAAAFACKKDGPFRSSAADLRRVEFDPRKLGHWNKKFISSLPSNIAIVGGFARGIYLGDMVSQKNFITSAGSVGFLIFGQI